jgi:hypothetical protein
MTNNKSTESSREYECKYCDYTTMRKSQYYRHLTTAKHQIRTNTNKIVPISSKIYQCECEKTFKHASSLWNHKQKCDGTVQPKSLEPVAVVDSSLVLELLKQNKELHEMVIDLAKNSGNTTTTNNNTINHTTNKFNLNVFLNETCKDAINLNDFIQSIELNSDDFVRTGEIGYVRGISDIMVERIRDMEPHTRPIHCTDLKRETIYVKDSDTWSKENENKTHLRKAVKIVAGKNQAQVHTWITQNPNYEILDSPECEKYFEYTKASLGGYGKEEDMKFDNKIINNILKETIINKELLESKSLE